MIQGLGLVYLLFRDSAHAKDRTFNLIARMIVISFACYIPVILFAPTHKLVGNLMTANALYGRHISVQQWLQKQEAGSQWLLPLLMAWDSTFMFSVPPP